jgi:Fic family protein
MLDVTLANLSEKKAQMDTYRPLSKGDVEALNRQKKYEHIWSSTALEGNSLTNYETIAFLETGLTVSGKPIKDYLEVLDLSSAYDYVAELSTQESDLNLSDLQDINRLVTMKTTRDISKAGKIRAIDVYPYGYPEEKYTSPYLIRKELEDFLVWYKSARSLLHPVEQAALIHFKLVSIHPFEDGNGRSSRLLMDMALMKNGYPIINIQPDKEARKTYMESLRTSRKTNQVSGFIALVADYVNRELDERLEILALNEKNNPPYESRLDKYLAQKSEKEKTSLDEEDYDLDF